MPSPATFVACNKENTMCLHHATSYTSAYTCYTKYVDLNSKFHSYAIYYWMYILFTSKNKHEQDGLTTITLIYVHRGSITELKGN